MSAIIRRVSYAEVLEAQNSKELLEEYAAECSLPELGSICPQREAYAKMEQTGFFQCFGVYDGENLIGFASVLTYIVPHYGKRIATVESLFLAAAYRNGDTGIKLMHTIEAYARAQSCVAILYSAPEGSQFERLLMTMKKYRHSNTVFLREL